MAGKVSLEVTFLCSGSSGCKKTLRVVRSRQTRRRVAAIYCFLSKGVGVRAVFERVVESANTSRSSDPKFPVVDFCLRTQRWMDAAQQDWEDNRACDSNDGAGPVGLPTYVFPIRKYKLTFCCRDAAT